LLRQLPETHAVGVGVRSSIHRLLEERARSRPDAVALVAPGRPPLTFGDLWECVQDTVLALNSLGIGRNDRVATVLRGGPEAALVFLAVASGATHAPLNPDYREREFEFLVSDLEPRALIVPAGADSPAVAVARKHEIPVIELTSVPGAPAGRFRLNAEGTAETAEGELAESGDVALVLHTSGTMSRPKLVPLTQQNLCGSAAHAVEALRLTPEDRCLAIMPPFHIHGLMATLLAPLAAGGSAVCTPGFVAPRFFEWMDESAPTWYSAVPTMHRSILLHAERHRDTIRRHPLRFIRSAGAPLSPRTMEELEATFRAPVIESFGMTEAAQQITSNPLPPGERRPGSAGIAAGPEVTVLDEKGNPVPPGTVGEVALRGPNVMHGYANDPETNAAAFTNGWFRSGDLGKLSEDGYLTLTGRIKQIINRGGEKISPREVDDVLATHPAVHEAVTIGIPDPRLGEDVAAVVVLNNGAHVTPRDLKHFVAARIAQHKVPREIRILEEIPASPTGKPQLRELTRILAMSDSGPAESDKPIETTPVSVDEKKMVAIWADVFHLERIGPHDDFLKLGGDSILAAILLGEVQEVFGVEVSLIDFHEARTPANLVDVVSRQRATGGAESAPRLISAPDAQYEPFPLTEVQEVYWAGRTSDFQLGNVSTHGYSEIDCTDLDLERLERAWQKLVDRHPMLRAVLLPEGGQRILERVPSYRIEIVDLRDRATDEQERELMAIRERMSHAVHPYDRWPLFQIRASLVDDRRTRLHMSLDALILDAWSRRSVLFPEWGQLYENPDCTLPPLELTFRDYVLAERAVRDAEHARASEYWERRLDDLPPAPELPLAANPDSIETPKFLRRTGHVEPEAWGSVRKRAARASLTATAVLATAFAEVLKTWSHKPRFTLNLTTFNRRPLHPQVTDVLGDFTSISLLEVAASGRAPFESRARELQERLWRDLDHSAMSGIQVMRALAARQEGVPRALMPIVLTSAIARDGRGDAHEWLGENVFGVAQTPQVWLDLHIFEEDGTLVINWNEVEELFPPGLMQEAFDAFVHRLRQLAREPESWNETAGPALVPRTQLDERARVNATSASIPESLLHTAFVEQAARRPGQAAVITPGRVVTYEEVLSTSNRVARLLRERGARPNTLVAVVTEKDWEQVPAVLGVLQAGAAYLPIDSTTPTERLHHLLKHAQVDLVVTQGCVDPVTEWPSGVQRITVNDRQLDGVSDDPLDPVQAPEDLAYVIYTSGSTGLPKGVMIDHRAAWNTIHAGNRRFEVLPEDRVFAISALSFDLSVYDIFGTLGAGGTIVMPEVSGLRDPVHWAEMIEREQVTIWDSVPALMELLVETAAGRSDLLPRQASRSAVEEHPLRTAARESDVPRAGRRAGSAPDLGARPALHRRRGTGERVLARRGAHGRELRSSSRDR
jgi:acyl-CoA synthetase (AMP-forming)/AMP-acid ligase II/acyl carrier protein